MRKLITLMVLACFILAGCEKQHPDLKGFDDLIGFWTTPVFEYNTDGKSIYTYSRDNTLLFDSMGIQFVNNGTLIERKNAGWCATPPITYDNYSGKWKIQNSDEIEIDVFYWGGMEHRIWKIIDVTPFTLKIEWISWETQ